MLEAGLDLQQAPPIDSNTWTGHPTLWAEAQGANFFTPSEGLHDFYAFY